MANNNIKSWMPRHPLIVTNGAKMSHFAKANAIRFGVTNGAGALQGVKDPSIAIMGDVPETTRSARMAYRIRAASRLGDVNAVATEQTGRFFNFEPETIEGDAYADGSSALPSSPMQSVNAFLNRLTSVVRSSVGLRSTATGDDMVLANPEPWWQSALGLAAVGGLAYLGYRGVKKLLK